MEVKRLTIWKSSVIANVLAQLDHAILNLFTTSHGGDNLCHFHKELVSRKGILLRIPSLIYLLNSWYRMRINPSSISKFDLVILFEHPSPLRAAQHPHPGK